ncbi:MAG: ABC transporter substrate-binding protein [Austwickia sp.]|nr:MAG: ABC transporter substrate-binding protein [Austwickia sp.]
MTLRDDLDRDDAIRDDLDREDLDRDDLGHPVPLGRAPERVISLVPSLTEAIATSYGDRPHPLIGATDWCTHPADLDVPRFGGTKNPAVEAIVAAAPDLVVANEEENKPEHVAALRDAGVPVWVTDIRDVPTALASLGRLLEVLAAPVRGWYDDAVAAWADPEPVARGSRITALVPIWRRPWMALGRDTYAGDVLDRIGVDHVLADHAERYPRIDPAQVAESTPYEVVLLPDEPYRFTTHDGPEAFDVPAALIDGRALTWYGPAMTAAPQILRDAIRAVLARGGRGWR